MKRNYFISYQYSRGSVSELLNRSIAIDGRISTMDDVKKEEKYIKDKFHDGYGNVVIINWKRMAKAKYKISPSLIHGNFEESEFETKDELLRILGPLEDGYVYAYDNGGIVLKVNRKSGHARRLGYTDCDKLRKWFPFCLEVCPVDATPKKVFRLNEKGLKRWEEEYGESGIKDAEFLDMTHGESICRVLFSLDVNEEEHTVLAPKRMIKFVRNATEEDYQKYRNYVKKEKEKNE